MDYTMQWTNGGKRRDEGPNYMVDHLATFGVGPQFGVQWPSDGIRKLKQMEKSCAIWAQPMLLRLRKHEIIVEDENGETVEQFGLYLVVEPIAHLSNDPRELYNNLLIFIVNEDKTERSSTQTEMHIFQCKLVGANEVVQDIRLYMSGRFSQVPRGFRDTGFLRSLPNGYKQDKSQNPSGDNPNIRPGYHQLLINIGNGQHVPDAIITEDPYRTSNDFERDVKTMNHCFDDIDHFVSIIGSSAMAQRELDMRNQRGKGKRSKKQNPEEGTLQSRAQLPKEAEFVLIFQKFKICFNLLAKLKDHIDQPNAQELLHFLFNPLTVLLEACELEYGRAVAQNIIQPLISKQAERLMMDNLTSKEKEVWMSLGDAWRVPVEEWPYPLPATKEPFQSAFHSMRKRNSVSPDSVHIDMERQLLQLEQKKLAIKEKALREKEKLIQEEKRKLDEMTRLFDDEKRSVISDHPLNTDQDFHIRLPSSRSTGDIFGDWNGGRKRSMRLETTPVPDSVGQRAFLKDLHARQCKVVEVIYNRDSQNWKELDVTKGEYLQVLNDTKKWWECRNMDNRIGYVPSTIVTVIQYGLANSDKKHKNGGINVNNINWNSSSKQNRNEMDWISVSSALGPTTPVPLRNRIGKRGEFRYF